MTKERINKKEFLLSILYLYKWSYQTIADTLAAFNNYPVEIETDNVKFSSNYVVNIEYLLLSTVCALGGHEGHFNYIVANLDYFYVKHPDTEVIELFNIINETVQNDYTIGNTKRNITLNEGLSKCIVGFKMFSEEMSDYLTIISGFNNNEPISFNRFEQIIANLIQLKSKEALFL